MGNLGVPSIIWNKKCVNFLNQKELVKNIFCLLELH
jgi:hypothetical protein